MGTNILSKTQTITSLQRGQRKQKFVFSSNYKEMGTFTHRMLLTCLLVSLFLPPFISAQSCVTETFSSNKLYASCNSLPVLDATLHWSYHASNGTADVAYRIPQVSTGWVAWAINPKKSGMIGANALFTFHDSTGTGAVKVVSTVISGYSPTVRYLNCFN